jgi:hypothetical protein
MNMNWSAVVLLPTVAPMRSPVSSLADALLADDVSAAASRRLVVGIFS